MSSAQIVFRIYGRVSPEKRKRVEEYYFRTGIVRAHCDAAAVAIAMAALGGQQKPADCIKLRPTTSSGSAYQMEVGALVAIRK